MGTVFRGVLIIGILLFRVLCWDPLFLETLKSQTPTPLQASKLDRAARIRPALSERNWTD